MSLEYRNGFLIAPCSINPGSAPNYRVSIYHLGNVFYPRIFILVFYAIHNIAEGRKALIGSNEHSVGWDLVNRCIRFNDCRNKSYPDAEVTSIPSKFTMVIIGASLCSD